MLQKISAYSLRTYVGFNHFVKDLKEDERGLSGVVVAVLLILVSVLAIVLIWGFLSGWLQELWDKITGAASEIKLEE